MISSFWNTTNFSHSKFAIRHDDGLPRPTEQARPPKAHPGIAMPPTNMQDEEGEVMSSKNVLCVVSFTD